MKQLFIPKTIRVGYQRRGDTYTKKLAYVIYFDSKGVLRKENSWTTWCDLPESPNSNRYWDGSSWADNVGGGIPSNDFENVPTEGFVLNKKVGGHSSGWNHRNTYTRVFDPRGFEFEISVENLLFILAEGDCTRGKGLEGKFVYSWQGTELVLLPIHSNDYKNCTDYSDLQGKKISLRDIVAGRTYITKRQKEFVYIGRLEKYKLSGEPSKSHVFYDPEEDRFTSFKSGKDLAVCKTEECHPDLAELVERYDIANSNIEVVNIRLDDGSDVEEDNWSGSTKRLCEFEGEIYQYRVCEYKYKWCRIEEEEFDPKKHLVKLHTKYFVDQGEFTEHSCDIIVWSPQFEKPPKEKNPRYNPNSSYAYERNEYLDERYDHAQSVKEYGTVSLGDRKIVITTKDGREFNTDTFNFKLRDLDA